MGGLRDRRRRLECPGDLEGLLGGAARDGGVGHHVEGPALVEDPHNGELLDPKPLLLASELLTSGLEPPRLVAAQLVEPLPEVEIADPGTHR